MGKPSLSSSSKSKLSETKKSSMDLTKSLQKNIFKQRRKSKTNKNLKKLFEKLRSENEASFSSSDSIVSQISNGSITDIDNVQTRPPVIQTDDYIIVHDTTPEKTIVRGTSSQPACSTPIFKKSHVTLENLLLNQFPVTNNNSFSENYNKNIEQGTSYHPDSFLTIDLTNETFNDSRTTDNTVIEIIDTIDSPDCTVVSVTAAGKNTNTETELHNNAQDRRLKRFAKGIQNMNASDKGRLLELIAENIFSGCDLTSNSKQCLPVGLITPKNTNLERDCYIKEVIVGKSPSRNSIGSNIYHPDKCPPKNGLRMIVIDGSNVAMEHEKGHIFSVKGLKICIDYFIKRGHEVKAFVPRFRCKCGQSSDPKLLSNLERRGLVVFTPSRDIQGRHITPYDDRYIVQCAAEFDGVIVSGDNYRDLLTENPRWRFVIENRVLPFTWVGDMIMFPRDPLGRNGPTLETFLKHTPSNNK